MKKEAKDRREEKGNNLIDKIELAAGRGKIKHPINCAKGVVISYA